MSNQSGSIAALSFRFRAEQLPKGTTVTQATDLLSRHGYTFRPGRFGFLAVRKPAPQQRA